MLSGRVGRGPPACGLVVLGAGSRVWLVVGAGMEEEDPVSRSRQPDQWVLVARSPQKRRPWATGTVGAEYRERRAEAQ